MNKNSGKSKNNNIDKNNTTNKNNNLNNTVNKYSQNTNKNTNKNTGKNTNKNSNNANKSNNTNKGNNPGKNTNKAVKNNKDLNEKAVANENLAKDNNSEKIENSVILSASQEITDIKGKDKETEEIKVSKSGDNFEKEPLEDSLVKDNGFEESTEKNNSDSNGEKLDIAKISRINREKTERLKKINNILIKSIDFIKKHAMIICAVIFVIIIAIVMTVGLNAHHNKQEEESASQNSASENLLSVDEDIPMQQNTDGDIYTLICTYYNAWATGDEETVRSVCDYISEQDMLRLMELSKYINYFDTLEIYTKPGPEVGSTIAFVYYKVVFNDYEDAFPAYQAHYICTDESGNLYIKRSDNSAEVDAAIQQLISQDDVVEFNNKINVEYNNLMAEKPELLDYLSKLDDEVSQAVGESLAQDTVSDSDAVSGGNVQTTDDTNETQQTADIEGETVEETYAQASTTVNVRVSDSEKADKLGKLEGGTKVKVLETRENGWTKIDYNGQDGYVKSEFLTSAESVSVSSAIGTATATTNINVRASADESSDRIGVLAGGESADLLSVENGWCKILYNGKEGYIKAEFAEVNQN